MDVPERALAVYHIREEERIGGGADGRVCRAVVRKGRPGAGEYHALKVFRAEAYDAQREIEMLRELQPHPHILELKGVFQWSTGRLAFASPELDFDLHRFLSRRPRGLELALARPLARQLALGLQHMHAHRCVHRDLKPHNILLRVGGGTGESSGMQLYIADFSRARRLPATGKPHRYRTKTVVDSECVALSSRVAMTPGLATPMYAAPEVSFSDPSAECIAGASQDIWSFGAVAFELRTGQALFYGAGPTAQWKTAISRLGPPPEGLVLGPLQRSVINVRLPSETEQSFQEMFPPLAQVSGLEGFLEFVSPACAWRPEDRPTAAELVRETHFLGEPPAGAQVALAASQGLASGRMDAPQATPSVLSTLAPASPHRPAMRRLFPVLTPLPTEVSAEGCQCKGHCYQPGHRYRGGCDQNEVVVGTNRCAACACSVRSCTRPRNSSPFCLQHKKVFESLPLNIKCLWHSRRALACLLPMDLEAFAQAWPTVRCNPLVALTACWMKEPFAIRRWCQSAFLGSCRTAGPDVDAEAMRNSLLGLLGSLSGNPNSAETQQLTQQGVGRNLGPARVATALGLIQVTPPAEEGDFVLGRGGRAYSKVSGDTCLETMLAAAARAQGAWQAACTAEAPGDVTRGLLEVFAALTTAGLRGIRGTGEDSYLRLFFVRMVLLARMAEGSGMFENPWKGFTEKRERNQNRQQKVGDSFGSLREDTHYFV